MREGKRRFTAIFLSICMILGMMPNFGITALAEEPDGTPKTVELKWSGDVTPNTDGWTGKDVTITLTGDTTIKGIVNIQEGQNVDIIGNDYILTVGVENGQAFKFTQSSVASDLTLKDLTLDANGSSAHVIMNGADSAGNSGAKVQLDNVKLVGSAGSQNDPDNEGYYVWMSQGALDLKNVTINDGNIVNVGSAGNTISGPVTTQGEVYIRGTKFTAPNFTASGENKNLFTVENGELTFNNVTLDGTGATGIMNVVNVAENAALKMIGTSAIQNWQMGSDAVLNSGSMTMSNDAKIVNNFVRGKWGIRSFGTLTMEGNSEVSGNQGNVLQQGTMIVAGNAKITEDTWAMQIEQGHPVTVQDGFAGSICVYPVNEISGTPSTYDIANGPFQFIQSEGNQTITSDMLSHFTISDVYIANVGNKPCITKLGDGNKSGYIDLERKEYHVKSGAASTGANGTTGYPYPSIQDAIAAMKKDNDVAAAAIHVMNDLDVNEASTLDMNKSIVIESCNCSGDTEAKTIKRTNKNHLFDISKGNVTFQNITLDGGYTGGTESQMCGLLNISKQGTQVTLGAGAAVQNAYGITKGSAGGDWGCIQIFDNGALTMLDGSKISNLTAASGPVRMMTGSTFNMKGGLIENCTSAINEGNAVYISGQSVMNMSGGSIEKCGSVNGQTLGTVYLHQTNGQNVFHMSGGSITGNTARLGGGVYMKQPTPVGSPANQIILSGNARIMDNKNADGQPSNIYLEKGQTVTVNDLGQGAKIGVYTAEKPVDAADVQFATGAKEADTKYFFSDNAQEAGVLYCTGSEDKPQSGYHSHVADTLWLSTAAKESDIVKSEYVTASTGSNGTVTITVNPAEDGKYYAVFKKDGTPVAGAGWTAGDSGEIKFENLDPNGGPYIVKEATDANGSNAINIRKPQYFYYVSKDGNDKSGTGIHENPYLTIRQAVGTIPVGADGTIILMTDVDFPYSGTVVNKGNSVTVVSESGMYTISRTHKDTEFNVQSGILTLKNVKFTDAESLGHNGNHAPIQLQTPNAEAHAKVVLDNVRLEGLESQFGAVYFWHNKEGSQLVEVKNGSVITGNHAHGPYQMSGTIGGVGGGLMLGGGTILLDSLITGNTDVFNNGQDAGDVYLASGQYLTLADNFALPAGDVKMVIRAQDTANGTVVVDASLMENPDMDAIMARISCNRNLKIEGKKIVIDRPTALEIARRFDPALSSDANGDGEITGDESKIVEVTMDKDGNYKVTLKDNINGTVSIPDTWGDVVVDLNGKTITGTAGDPNGDKNGQPAVILETGNGENHYGTNLTFTDSSKDKTGKLVGGAGVSGGNGGMGVSAADDANTKLILDGVNVQGGKGADAVTNDTPGGIGGAGIAGSIDVTVDGGSVVTGGDGGKGFGSGDGGDGGAGVNTAGSNDNHIIVGDATVSGGNGGAGSDTGSNGGNGGSGLVNSGADSTITVSGGNITGGKGGEGGANASGTGGNGGKGGNAISGGSAENASNINISGDASIVTGGNGGKGGSGNQGGNGGDNGDAIIGGNTTVNGGKVEGGNGGKGGSGINGNGADGASAPKLSADNNTVTVTGCKPGESYTIRKSDGTTVTKKADANGKLTFTGLEAGTQYVVTDSTGKIVGSIKTEESGGSPSGNVTISSGKGGSVSVNPKNPSKGDRVTIIPKPDKGYEVDSVSVTDSHGNKIEVIDNGDGTYTYIQPEGGVNIEVTFKKIAKEPSTDGDKKPVKTPGNTDKSTTSKSDKSNASANTGDNSNMWMWAVVLFISCGGILGAAIHNRKRRTHEN